MSKQMLIAAKSTRMRGTLARLRSDASGNVLAMAAAAIFPLAGMMGGALDLSRIYLVKTRLQAACDAGALTGRRVMGSGSWANNSYKARTQAENVFLTNFGENSYGTGTLTKTFTENAGNVSGVASTTIPMTVMQLFGSGTHTVNVSCNSEQRIPNTDVMFVLDTTGSMNCAPAETPTTTPSCTNNGGVEKPDAKMKGLRTAVKCFYEALAKLDTAESCGSTPSGGNSASVQLRFGIMPYSSNVNVGKLLPTSYFPDNWTYQSKSPVITNGYSYVLGTESGKSGFGTASNATIPSTFNTNTSTGWGTWGTISTNATNTTTVNGTVYIHKKTLASDGTTAVSSTNCSSWNALSGSGSPTTLLAKVDATGVVSDTLTGTSPNPPTWSASPPSQQTLTYSRTEPHTVTGYRYNWQSVGGTNGCWLVRAGGSYNRVATGGTSTKSITWTPQSYVTGWSNQVVNFDISGLKNGTNWNGSVDLPMTETNGPTVFLSGSNSSTALKFLANSNVTWSGCIEERRTYQNIDPTDPSLDWSPVPSVANDMNIDMIPDMSDINTQWKPALPGALIDPSNGASGSNTLSCPAQATRLQTYPTPSTFETDVDSLIARGSTYHDVGLIWGARFMSPTGIFAAANATTPSGGAIQRHMIFMTDGDTGTCSGAYSPHGVVGFGDRRQTTKASIPDNGGSLCNNDFLNKIVDARTAAACTAIKNMNITLWVIGFGTGVSAATKTRLTNCASPNSYFDAADSATLNTKFKQIADDISQLRLTN
jgi:Flp pilus assembly protein TadG